MPTPAQIHASMKGSDCAIFIFCLHVYEVAVCLGQLEGSELRSFVSNIESYIDERLGAKLLEDALIESSSQFNADSESIANSIEWELSNEFEKYANMVTRLKTAFEKNEADGNLLTTRDCCDKYQDQVP